MMMLPVRVPILFDVTKSDNQADVPFYLIVHSAAKMTFLHQIIYQLNPVHIFGPFF